MAKVDLEALEAAKRASVGQLLLRCARLLDERALARVAKASRGRPTLRPAHTRLLPHITMEGVRLTELAAKLGVTKQAVGQLVADMESMGYVSCAADPADARAKLVRFTPKGVQGIHQGLGVLREIEGEIEARLGAEAMKALHESLLATLEVLES